MTDERDPLSDARRKEVDNVFAAARELTDTSDPELEAALAEIEDLIGNDEGSAGHARQVRATADGHFVLGRHLRSVKDGSAEQSPGD